MITDEDEDVKPGMAALELRLKESEVDSRQALGHQLESSQILRQQINELHKRLEDKENKLVEANEIIRVLRNEVQTLQHQLELQRRLRLRNREPHRFVTFKVGLLLDPYMDILHEQKVETPQKVKVPVSLSSMEFHNFLRDAFPRLGSSDFQLVKVDAHKRITALQLTPLTPSMLIYKELNHSTLYILPEKNLEELGGEEQDGSHVRDALCRENSSNASGLDDPGQDDPRTGDTDTEGSPERSRKDQDVTAQSPQQSSSLEADCALRTAGYVSPPNLHVSCTSEDNPEDLPASPSSSAVRSSKSLTNSLRMTPGHTGTVEQRKRAPRPFVTLRVGLLLDPHMDKLCPQKAEASRKINVPVSLSAKEFHDVLRGVFPRLGSTDFQLVKVDGRKRITALQISPVTPSVLKASGALRRSGLYILPKDDLRKKVEDSQKRVFVSPQNHLLSYTLQDGPYNDDAGTSSQTVPKKVRETIATLRSAKKRPQERFLTLRVGLLLDPRLETLQRQKAEASRKINVPVSLSAKEFHDVLRGVFPRLGSTDFQLVKVDGRKRITALQISPVTPSALKASGELRHSALYILPKAHMEPHVEIGSNAPDRHDVPDRSDSEFGSFKTERSPERSHTDQDVITPNAQQRPLLETNSALESVGYVSPPNLFLSCTSEDNPADSSVSLSDGAGRSLQQGPLRLVTVKLEDCREMLGPNGVYKMPTEDGNHDEEGSYGYDQYSNDDDDGDSNFNPATEGLDSSTDGEDDEMVSAPEEPTDHRQTEPEQQFCTRTFSNLTSLRAHQDGQCEKAPSLQRRRELKVQRRKKCHKCRDCRESFPSKSQLLVHQKIHRKDKTGGRKTVYAKRYKCSDCGKAFSFPSQLAIHQRTHVRKESSSTAACKETRSTLKGSSSEGQSPEKSHACAHCNKTFAVLRYLKDHIRRQHKLERVYQCSYCSESFAKASLLKIHRQGPCKESFDRDRRSHQCDECGKMLMSRANLKDHKLIHTGQRPHACTRCNSAFTVLRHLYDHLRRKHGEGPYKERVTQDKYQCDECGKLVSSHQNLNFHKRIHTGERPHTCSVCNKTFALLGNLRQHQKLHTQERPHECSHCHKKFSTASSLKQHVRSHTGEKPYACTACSKSFSTRESLNNHRRWHEGVRPYMCLQCGKRFRSSSGLINHEKTHMAEKPHPCPHCSRPFRSKQLLKRHVRTHTGEKPYKCSFCDKAFVGHAGRMKHERTHTGEKPYCCSVCGKAFAYVDALKTHQRVHTGEKPFQCTVCGERFRYLQTLQSHQKRLHRDGPSNKCSQCGESFKTSKELKSHKCVQERNDGLEEEEVEEDEVLNGLKTI